MVRFLSKLRRRKRERRAAIYLHYPCFDGVASAVIAANFLTGALGWKQCEVEPVDYSESAGWLERPLAERSAVVDFLYHPHAQFWADHHGTTFLTESARHDYENHVSNRILLYDAGYPSCAKLLFDTLRERLTNEPRYRELAHWANKIDSADYSSAAEAIFGRDAAIEINLSLNDPRAASRDYCRLLFESLLTGDIERTASLPEVRSLARSVREREERGLRVVENNIALEPSDIAVFTATQNEEATVNRYAPYLFLPNARYSVAVVGQGGTWKITAMRNPWANFASVELGEIFRGFGGGGHRRVASLLFSGDIQGARDVQRKVVAEIQRRDSEVGHSQKAYA
jgi:hypothetical protein